MRIDAGILMHKSNDELFEKYLKTILGKKFTRRQVDIVSCIMSMRGSSQIAQILDLSTKTVEAHITNIYLKFADDNIRINSRDQLITFIEKSGIAPIVRAYYLNLRKRNELQKTLLQIARILRNRGYCFKLAEDPITDDETTDLISQVERDLTTMGFANNPKDIEEFEHKYFIFSDLSDHGDLQGFTAIGIKTRSNFVSLNKGNSVDFSIQHDYPFSFIELVKKLCPSENLGSLLDELHNSLKSLNTLEQTVNIQNSTDTKAKIIHYSLYSLIAVLTIATALMLYSSYQSYQTRSRPAITNTTESNTFADFQAKMERENHLIAAAEQRLDFFVNNFTANYLISAHSAYRNTDIAESAIDFIEELNDDEEFLELLISASAQNLVKYAFCTISIGNYYMSIKHDGMRARKILLWSKNLIERYLAERSKVHFDYSNLSKEELYSELSAVEDLAPIYARLLYTIGRTYMYTQGKWASKEYFNRALFISKKLNLFESHLSELNGIGSLKNLRIRDLIGSNQYDKAKMIIDESINLHRKLLGIHHTYILDYTPFLPTQKMISVEDSSVNRVCCVCKLAELYRYYIEISEKKKDKIKMYNKVLELLRGGRNSEGVMEDLSFEQVQRKTIYLLNNAGLIMLDLLTNEIEFKELRELFASVVEAPKNASDLEYIISLFTFCKEHSKNADYTKSDACRGLAKALRAQAKHAHDMEIINSLEAQAQHLLEQADQLDEILGRN